MITQYRSAYSNLPKAPAFSGLSTDAKPTDVDNGAVYEEIDTGVSYAFDAENALWYEIHKSGGGGGSSITTVSFVLSSDTSDVTADKTPQEVRNAMFSTVVIGVLTVRVNESVNVLPIGVCGLSGIDYSIGFLPEVYSGAIKYMIYSSENTWKFRGGT